MYAYFKYRNRPGRNPNCTKQLLARWMLVFSVFVSSTAGAVDMQGGKLQLHGFITQGMVNTTGNNFLGKSRDEISYDFREVGLNATYRALPQLQISTQLISRKAGQNDNGELRVGHAFVDWTVASGDWGSSGVRFGRVRVPYGLYAETGDVAFTRDSAILPQPIYFDVTRRLQKSADGLSLYHNAVSDYGNFGIKYYLGYPQADGKSTEATFLGKDMPGRLDSKLTQLVNFSFDSNNGQWRLGFTAANVKLAYDRKASDSLSSGDITLVPYLLSAQYNAEKWTLTAEYLLEFLEFKGFGPLMDSKTSADGFYMQVAYRPASKWEVFTRYDAFYRDRSDRHGREWQATTGLPDFMLYSKDWSAGVRYDVNESFSLRAEAHRINGAGWLSPLENSNPAALEKNWDMLILLASYRF